MTTTTTEGGWPHRPPSSAIVGDDNNNNGNDDDDYDDDDDDNNEDNDCLARDDPIDRGRGPCAHLARRGFDVVVFTKLSCAICKHADARAFVGHQRAEIRVFVLGQGWRDDGTNSVVVGDSS